MLSKTQKCEIKIFIMSVKLFADFHLHSKYTVAADKTTDIKNIAKIAKLKGLNLLGTGDGLYIPWIKELKENLKNENGMYYYDSIYFIPSVEIKINTYVHSVILSPSLDYFIELKEKLKKYGKIDKITQPNLNINVEELIDILKEYDMFLFPAHIFIPWQSLYAKYSSIQDFFKSKIKEIYAVELGLSADPKLANEVKELACFTFLTNSDAHTHWEIGREFNLIEVNDVNYKQIIKAIKENKVINYTQPGELGKYHLTRCRNCKTFFHYNDALHHKFTCPICKGKIKLGVKDRIKHELSKNKEICTERKQRNYVIYISLLKLLEDLANIKRDEAKELCIKILEKYKTTEIDLLYNLDLEKIGEDIRKIISVFRNNSYYIFPGGGYEEGKVQLEKPGIEFYSRKNKSMEDFLR